MSRISRPWLNGAAILLGALLIATGIGGCTVAQPLKPAASLTLPAEPQVSPQRLQTHVRVLSEDFLGRSFDQPQTLQKAADYIVAQLAQWGVTAERQRFEVNGNGYENLSARFGPADSAAPLLIMGAHYDSALTERDHRHDEPRVTGARPTPETHTPGADDNASGVAGLLELARVLVANPPTQPVELVFYTLEEPPNFRTDDMGSYRHAKSLQDSGRTVRLMLSVEMIGYYSDAPGSQRYPLAPLGWFYPSQANFLGLIGELKNFGAMRRTRSVMRAAAVGDRPLGVHSLNAPRFVHGVDFSDHLNYWRLGYPAIMVTDTSFMRNPHYYKSTDTWDRLDYERMAQVVRMLAAVALDVG
ncbi:MAG: M28 family peptidase [Comamonas sp.]|jgi:Zn-dependent M28 family amino/carboxypeptidase|uniref:M28 family peptidase n=1 Tax=Comamonas sp. TaxID=34028 RepID=UPI002817796C|nr:M28 family peptidase [Comamonas sp.]MDR0214509.1 M28 family peptidase [Comamonas sp.]